MQHAKCMTRRPILIFAAEAWVAEYTSRAEERRGVELLVNLKD
jgi:hypothetical protein